MPAWLIDRERRRGTRVSPALLRDVWWGQYCLFLCIRIHDDLLDRQVGSPPFIFVADSLLIEAERAFARHARSRAFWNFFRGCVDQSCRAIVTADLLQRSGARVTPGGAARVNAEVSAILKVGSAAVCAACGRMRDLDRLSRFADELAAASQWIDDLLDIDEDLRAGKLNFAASRLRLARRPGDRIARRRLARTLLVDGGIEVIADDVDAHLQRAQAIAESLRIAPAIAYVRRYRTGLGRFRDALHRVRVESLFAPLLHGRGAVR